MSNRRYRTMNAKPAAKPASKPFAEVEKLAKQEAYNWYYENGGQDLELMMQSARQDIHLHLLETDERIVAKKAGEEMPKRWTVAPAACNKARDQLMKLLVLSAELKERAAEATISSYTQHGYNPDGSQVEDDEPVGEQPIATDDQGENMSEEQAKNIAVSREAAATTDATKTIN